MYNFIYIGVEMLQNRNDLYTKYDTGMNGKLRTEFRFRTE